MMQREHIENFLRINKISISAPDAEIKQALLSARWHIDDVGKALHILKGDIPIDDNAHAAHEILLTDNKIQPETLNALLGMDVALNRRHIRETSELFQEDQAFANIYIVSVIFASFAFLFLAGIIAMYVFEVGIFYSPIPR